MKEIIKAFRKQYFTMLEDFSVYKKNNCQDCSISTKKSLPKDIKEACRLMGISLQDHIIISKSEYLSFREEGIIRFD